MLPSTLYKQENHMQSQKLCFFHNDRNQKLNVYTLLTVPPIIAYISGFNQTPNSLS